MAKRHTFVKESNGVHRMKMENGEWKTFKKGDIVKCESRVFGHRGPEDLGFKPVESDFSGKSIVDNTHYDNRLFEKKSRGGGWYDVINRETGEVMNEKALKEKEADALINGDDIVTDEDITEEDIDPNAIPEDSDEEVPVPVKTKSKRTK